MKIATLPGKGEYIGPISYFIYDEVETKILVKELFGNFFIRRLV